MVTIRPNLRGREQVLNSDETERAVAKLAEQVAENARSTAPDVEGVPGAFQLPVTVVVGKTSSMRINRVKAWVNLAHPAGLAVQAKHGTLTKAASAAGLKVKEF